MNEFKGKVVSGLKWNVGSSILNQILRLLITLVLARLLAPEVFGQVAMVTVLINFLTLLVSFGLGAAIIQKEKLNQAFLSTVFWTNLAIAGILATGFYFSSTFIAHFYDQPEVAQLVKLLSVLLIFSAISVVPKALLSKKLNFKSLAIINISTTLISGLIAVFMALLNYGVFAIISQILINGLSSGISIFFLAKWRPSFKFRWKSLRSVAKFGSFLSFNSFLNFLSRNLDSLLVGKYLGSYNLGLYNKSFSLMNLPIRTITTGIGQVLFSSISKIKDDLTRTRRVYLKIVATVAFFSFPMAITIFVLADKFVILVMGQQWIETIPVIRIFCFYSLWQSIGPLATNIFMARDRTELMFKVGLTRKLLLIGSIILGLFWGIQGVAICYTIAGISAFLVIQKQAGQLIGLSLLEVFRNVSKPFTFALLAGLAMYLVDQWVLMNLDLIVRACGQLIVGAALYIALHEWKKDGLYTEIKNLLIKRQFKL